MFMLCRNRVANFAKWKRGFDSHAVSHSETGLKFVRMWRDMADKNNVFFIFEVTSLTKAKAFISAPEATEAGRKFGVLDGEYYFAREVARTRTKVRRKSARARTKR